MNETLIFVILDNYIYTEKKAHRDEKSGTWFLRVKFKMAAGRHVRKTKLGRTALYSYVIPPF